MGAAAERARLDYDFNLRERCPNYGRDFAFWESESAVFRRAWPASQCDLAYGPHSLERYDLFLPSGDAGPVPFCLYLHPGSWQRLDKSLFSMIAPPLLDRGIAVAAVNYPLVPEVTIGGIVGRVRACLAEMRRDADRLGLDPDRIGMIGHSAGGHLAAMIHARASELDPGLRRAIRVVASVGGFYDLEPVRRSFMNMALGLDPETARDLSPISGEDRLDCPFVLVVGERETGEFRDQQRRMAEVLRRQGADPLELILPGQDHFSLVAELASRPNPVMTAVADALLAGVNSSGPGL
ncbi:alpha/beta hydrolase [Pukyongiella litopenaei]|nr:alpha/beta hydrolase [Pukyongiella litopenaei]